MDIPLKYSSLLLEALGNTLLLSFAGGAAALIIGLIIALFRLSPVPALVRVGTFYVETIRNTPLTVVFFIVVFVLPQIDLALPNYTATAIASLGVYTGAFVSEAIRAGVNTIGVGQAEAARALGLTFGPGMGLIILPQAVRAVVPPMANVWIALVKNSSIAAAFGVTELTAAGQRINFQEPGDVVAALLWIAVAYLIITLSSGQIFRLLERKMAVAR
ncbi:glutamate transport system permease protein [Paenarthrobacter nicotinovorans]|jgi:glutamate transport system permease protein|uniref:Glutamate transport system permease protein n=1 Tax=Paenarthrobacter nicotinovorans TaxID=29320 RepID=A0ABT9TMY6_PAENI|nr:amino acid ABC transporter permease [Paenarthrobacter nicotinovorans]MDQ0103036.1 glutamate transport system permease protein [Paenarthrobacter nicotinovorans]GAT89432.1 amino acid ABC transporter permease [Paenarthrobacter nicotinovorans]